MKNLIKLNVGGELFTTTMNTLSCTTNENFLAYLVTNNLPKDVDGDGNIFIDRDPNLFKYILHYLRNLKLSSTIEDNELEDLMEEANFFSIQEMVVLVQQKLSLIEQKEMSNIFTIEPQHYDKQYRLRPSCRRGATVTVIHPKLTMGKVYDDLWVKILWRTDDNYLDYIYLNQCDYALFTCLGNDIWVLMDHKVAKNYKDSTIKLIKDNFYDDIPILE